MPEIQDADPRVEVEEQVSVHVSNGAASPFIERKRQCPRIQDRRAFGFLLQAEEREGFRTRRFHDDPRRAGEVEVREAVHGSPAEVEMDAAAFARTGNRTGSSFAFSGVAFATRPTIVR